MAAPAVQRPSAKWIVLGSWQWVVCYRQSTGLKWAELQCSDTGIWDRRSVSSCWMHLMWQKVRLPRTPPSLVGVELWRQQPVLFTPVWAPLLWAEAGKSWLGRGGRLTVVSISSAMTTSSKAIMERRVFFGVHLSLFNWLRFTEFAIWFIFPLTAQPRTAPALKAHHLVPHFKWVMLLLRGIRKMLDQLLENRECQLCILFLSECLDFKIYYCFNIYSMILIPKLPKRLSNSDSGDSSCVL